MLYIIATPIGNLGDISFRAIETLKQVEVILCEDTRITRRLLERYEIKDKELISYHQHTSPKKVKGLIELVQKGSCALVSDAGTPGISDPGNKLIDEYIKSAGERAEIVPIPGASAVMAALSISGLPTDEFIFLGFIPHKKGRNKLLQEAVESKRTVVFYESPYRIIKCLEQLKELGAVNKRLVVGRELTKKFETIYRGNIDQVLEAVGNDPVKGEYTVVVG